MKIYYIELLSKYRLRLPNEIKSAYEELKAMEMETESFFLKRSHHSQKNKLKNILQLSCFGYNSSKTFQILC